LPGWAPNRHRPPPPPTLPPPPPAPPLGRGAAPEAPAPGELRADVALALALANHGSPMGEVAALLRLRLRGHIRALLPAARGYAASIADQGARDVAERTVIESQRVAEAGDRTGAEAAQCLRMLAKAVDTLALYGSAAVRSGL
jgi:hypothetical protein